MRNRSWIYITLMTVTLIGMSLLLSQVPAEAGAVRCDRNPSNTTDTDGDGFTDYQECNGITLFTGNPFLGYNSKGINPRSQYLDPNSKDLFVILVRSDDPGGLGGGPTKITKKTDNATDVAYWFPYVSNAANQTNQTTGFGLGIAVHLIYPTTTAPAPADRTVCPTCALPTGQSVKQKMIKVTESLDQTADNVIGYTSLCGTPDGPDLTTVYTQKIYNLLRSIQGTVQPATLELYIKHTIAHEIGHTVGPLAPVNYPEYGQYHYQSADNNLIMDQSVYVSGSNVYVGTRYTAGDQGGIHLK